MIDFLIFYETKNREFENIALLGNELKRRGYSVEYFSFFSDRSFSKCKKYFNNVRVAAMPSMYHEEELLKIVYTVAGRVDNIINLRWEQVYTNATEINKDYYIYPKGLAKEAYNCCWGDRPKQILIDAGVSENKIEITGPIHMDFLKPNFKGYYHDKNELLGKYNIPTNKNCVLYISSFRLSTMKEEKLKSYLLQYNESERKRISDFVDIEKKTRTSITDWLIKLSNDRDCIIIYRPHPVELETDEIKKLYNTKNIKVISDDNIKQWVLACDQIYTWYSTSYAEAYFSNKSVNVLRPFKIDYDDELTIYNGLDFITNYDGFLSSYDKNLKSNSKQAINPNIALYYKNSPNEYNYKYVADYFEKIYSLKSRFPWNKISILDYAKLHLFSIKTDFSTWFYYKFSKKYIDNQLFRFVFKRYLERIEFVLKHREINSKQIVSDSEFESLMNKMKKYMD